jgi:hypothetical protein
MSLIKIRVDVADQGCINADVIGPLSTAVSNAVRAVLQEMYGSIERPEVAVTINEPDPEPAKTEAADVLPKVLPRR